MIIDSSTMVFAVMALSFGLFFIAAFLLTTKVNSAHRAKSVLIGTGLYIILFSGLLFFSYSTKESFSKETTYSISDIEIQREYRQVNLILHTDKNKFVQPLSRISLNDLGSDTTESTLVVTENYTKIFGYLTLKSSMSRYELSIPGGTYNVLVDIDSNNPIDILE